MMVSVVIPVYNAVEYLRDCVSSVLNQTYRDLEVILVDDGSTDGSGQLCDVLQKTDERIKVFHNANRGANRSRAFGVLQSTGDCVLFVDSDDTIPEYAVMEYVSNSEGADIVVGFLWESPDPKRRISIQEWRRMCAFGGYVMSPVAKLFRRELLDEGVFDIPSTIRVCEDDIMNLKISLRTEKDVVILKRKCYEYNKHNAASVTTTFQWTYRYLEHFCQVYRGCIPTEMETVLMPPFIARRLKAVHSLIADSAFSMLAGMRESELVSTLMSDARGYSFPLSVWDSMTLSHPDSPFIWCLHHIRKKAVIGREFIARKFKQIWKI